MSLADGTPDSRCIDSRALLALKVARGGNEGNIDAGRVGITSLDTSLETVDPLASEVTAGIVLAASDVKLGVGRFEDCTVALVVDA